MKTLQNEVIIHDDDCPMCKIYTGAFLKFKMLDPNRGRIAYSDAYADRQIDVDWDRARHEIALYNSKTHEVTYGLESLIRILSHNFPWIRTVFNFRPVQWLLRQLYMFISYNRKVIAPAGSKPGVAACEPDYSLKFRIAYILFAWFLTAGILSVYANYLSTFIAPGGMLREFVICGGQLIFQSVFLAVSFREKIVPYFGQLMTVSLIGAIALLPAMLMASHLSQTIMLIYFLGVVCFMLAEHIRRVRLLHFPAWLSHTWVIYRILVLIYLLKLL